MPGFDTVATKSHHHQPVNATTLVLGWKLVTALGISAKADFPKPGSWKPLFPKPTPNYVNTVACGNGTWVAAGDFGHLATSTDGLTWTQRDSSALEDWPLGAGTGYELTSAAYGNGRTLVHVNRRHRIDPPTYQRAYILGERRPSRRPLDGHWRLYRSAHFCRRAGPATSKSWR
jgi:hypothetical protein